MYLTVARLLGYIETIECEAAMGHTMRAKTTSSSLPETPLAASLTEETAMPQPTYWDGKRPCSLLATRTEIMLSTTCVCPPIPTRSMDWSAIDDNTYDASYDEGNWRQGPHGVGETEQDAIEDLFDQLEAKKHITDDRLLEVAKQIIDLEYWAWNEGQYAAFVEGGEDKAIAILRKLIEEATNVTVASGIGPVAGARGRTNYKAECTDGEDFMRAVCAAHGHAEHQNAGRCYCGAKYYADGKEQAD
jgi:hypothetical protein